MRWRRKWTEKPSQMEMAMSEAAGDRLLEVSRGWDEEAVHYVWIKGGFCGVTMPDGTTHPRRIRRQVGTG